MILRSAELKNFGKHTEKIFEFRRGLNLVSGPNESGKSTLIESIPAVLFGLKDKSRFRSWRRQGDCTAALVFEVNGKNVRIERDMMTDQVKLLEQDDLYNALYAFEGKASPQGRSSEKVEYLQQVARLFGLAEEDVFRASIFFGQGNLEFSSSGGLGEKIRSFLSGFVEVDYDSVLESLTTDYFAITRENPWGKNKTRNRELDEICERIGEIERRWYEVRDSLTELDAISAKVASLKDSVEADSAEFAKGERYLNWVRNQWRLEEKEGTLRKDFNRISRQTGKIAELQSKRTEILDELQKTGLPAEVPADLILLLSEAEKIRTELVAIQKESVRLRETLLDAPHPPLKTSLILTTILFAIGAQVFLLPALKGVAWGVCGILLFGQWGYFLRKFLQLRTEQSRIKGQAQILERQREEVQCRLSGLDDRFEILGLSPSAVQIVKMQKNLSRHQELSDRLREIESALTVLENEEELNKEKEDLARELAVIGERMERQKPLQRDGILPLEDIPDAEERLLALGESIKAREKEILDLMRREASLQGELAEIRSLEVEGEKLKDRQEKLARRRDILAIGTELLAGAVDDFRKTHLERFAEDLGRNFSTITGGRYRDVQLEDNFNVKLRTPSGGWQPLESFSRGTCDSLYLALRLSLTRHLSPGRDLPLFMDDPFVNLDRHRLAQVFKILEILSRDNQVILFAHDESILRKAARDRWNLIPLAEIKISQEPDNQERSQDVGQLYLL